ncbi:MAG TPA: EVE domain-containing protein [Chloroflexota bacterium]|nr:EVE domain-containing protein [Chloroflexota bacterium]
MARGWLLKTEPGEYAFADLQRDGTTPWDGVRNPQAQKNMRAMAVGDRCVIYHTGDVRACVGLAEVARAAYPDPAHATGRWCLVDVRAGAPLARPVPLAVLRADPRFADSPLLRQGRLSVVPLTDDQWEALLALAGDTGG